VIAGLGNPGRAYARTPHNMGFMVIDELAARCECRLRSSWRVRALTAKATLGGHELLLLQPQTFMNNSGAAVAPALRHKGASPADLLVIVDDADLPLGSLRIRPRGGTAGHKGLASIAGALGTQDFARLRIGIGRGAQGTDLVEHVLRGFTADEWAQAQTAIKKAADAVGCILEEGLEKAMNQFNTRDEEAARPRKAAGGEDA
jgi:peptidyl-tRNA hydrolase, PTH1 family